MRRAGQAFEKYSRAEIGGYGGMKDAVGYYVVNHIDEGRHLTHEEIAEALGNRG